jgi:GT2 family glycosyltransferase
MHKISVVIPTFNAVQTLGEQLAALARQDGASRVEVVISDNGSIDGTQALARTFMPQLPGLIVVDASSIKGCAHARNVGALAATREVILFCDQDDVVGSGWLAAMQAALVNHPLVAARLDHRYLNPSWSSEVYGEPQRNALADTEPSFLPFAWGTTLGVRRDLHLAIGGFNESLHGGGEDNDYCYRLQLAGTALHFVPNAVVYYRHRQSLVDIFRQARGYGHASAVLLGRYRDRGMQRPSQARALASWLSLPLRAPFEVLSRAGRARCVKRFGWRLGRVEGSFEARILGL